MFFVVVFGNLGGSGIRGVFGVLAYGFVDGLGWGVV